MCPAAQIFSTVANSPSGADSKADLAASVLIPTDDESGTVEEQGYDLVNGNVMFGVWWSATDVAFQTGDCTASILHSAPEILGVPDFSDWLVDDSSRIVARVALQDFPIEHSPVSFRPKSYTLTGSDGR